MKLLQGIQQRVENGSTERILLILLGLILVLGFWLRTSHLDAQGLWFDEFYTLAHTTGTDLYLFEGSDYAPDMPIQPAQAYTDQMAEDRFWEMHKRNVVHEGHPPLYFYCMRFWTEAFGRSPFMLRFFSVLTSMLTVGLLYPITRMWMPQRESLLAVAVLAVSPFHVYFAMEARNYSIAWLFVTVAMLGASGIYCEKPPPRRYWILWATGVAFAMLSHYYAPIFCAVLAAALVLFKKPWSWKRVFLTGAPFTVAFPLLLLLKAQNSLHSAHWTDGAAPPGDSLQGFIMGLSSMLSGPNASAPKPEALLIGLTFLGILGFGLAAKERTTRRVALVGTGILLAHGFLVYGLDLVIGHHTIMIPRYSGALSMMIPLLIGLALTSKSVVPKLLLAVFLALTFRGAFLTARGERMRKQIIREVSQYIGGEAGPNDMVVVWPSGPNLAGVAAYLPAEQPVGSFAVDRWETEIPELLHAYDKVWFVLRNFGIQEEVKAHQTADALESHVTEFQRNRLIGLDLIQLQ